MKAQSGPLFVFAIVFFTFLIGAFYAVAYSVLKGVIQNYRLYYQKADLQWTGPKGEAAKPNRMLNLLILAAVSLASAWLVVTFLVF